MARTLFGIVLLGILLPSDAIRSQDAQRDSTLGAGKGRPEAASLFPKDSLLYFEFVNPRAMTTQLQAMLKGSLIENLPEYLAQWREERSNNWVGSLMENGFFMTFLGPEMLAEIGRLQGIAVAVTRIDEADEPAFVGVIFPGESHLPGFLTRFFLTVDGSARLAGKVGDVPIFGFALMADNLLPVPAVPLPPIPMPRPKPVPQAPFVAKMEGLIVIGSHLADVEDVIKRWQGKAATPSLASWSGWQSSSSLQKKPGFFASLRTDGIAPLVKWITEGDEDATQFQQMLPQFLSPELFPNLQLHLGLLGDAVELRFLAERAPKSPHPLLEVLTSPASPESLKFGLGVGALNGWGFRLKNWGDWFHRCLTWADRVLTPFQMQPSQGIAKIEKKLQISFQRDLLDRIDEICWTWPPQQQLPPGATDIPMCCLILKDEAAAERWESLLPHLIGAFADEPLEPITELVQGTKVRSLASNVLPWNAPLHYGRSNQRLVFGIDRKLVATVLRGQGSVPDSIAKPALDAFQNSPLIGFWHWGGHLSSLLAASKDGAFMLRDADAPAAADAERNQRIEHEKLVAAWTSQIPPLIATLEIAGKDQLPCVVLRQVLPPAVRGKLLDEFFRSLLERSEALEGNVPLPPPPPPPIKN
jgi:hypothetical protein